MSVFFHRLIQILTNRFERFYQLICKKKYDKLLYEAYTKPNGEVHTQIQQHSKVEYGLATGDPKKNKTLLEKHLVCANPFFSKEQFSYSWRMFFEFQKFKDPLPV